MKKLKDLNPHIANLAPYVPGEQPQDKKYIKLNTNENPYPPAPGVEDVIRNFDFNAARKYPDPLSTKLREAIAERFGFTADNIVVGNGSDEILRMICHAFPTSGDNVGQLEPSFTFYPVLNQMFGLNTVRFPVNNEGQPVKPLELDNVSLFFLANPNPPYGTPYAPAWIAEVAENNPECLIVVDEAYADFADENCLELVHKYQNIALSRTFSKSHSLAGMRIGYAIGNEWLIEAMMRVRDIYNVNALSQAAALAAFQDAEYTRECAKKIRATRERTITEMQKLGFEISSSAGNFFFARCDNAAEIYQQLRDNGILVRYFSTPPVDSGLRITIGTDEEMDQLLAVLQSLSL